MSPFRTTPDESSLWNYAFHFKTWSKPSEISEKTIDFRGLWIRLLVRREADCCNVIYCTLNSIVVELFVEENRAARPLTSQDDYSTPPFLCFLLFYILSSFILLDLCKMPASAGSFPLCFRYLCGVLRCCEWRLEMTLLGREKCNWGNILYSKKCQKTTVTSGECCSQNADLSLSRGEEKSPPRSLSKPRATISKGLKLKHLSTALMSNKCST